MCHSVVVDLQVKYSDIMLVYVRSHFPYIDQSYKDYLLNYYDDTLIPNKVINAGKASYVERNQENSTKLVEFFIYLSYIYIVNFY